MQEQEIFLLEGHRNTFLGTKHKSAIWDRTPPIHLHIKPSLYVCRRVQESQIFKQTWIISIHSRVIVILLIWISSALGVGQVGGGYLGWSIIVYRSSGMFRGKESLKRIKLSWLVQDLLNFGDLGSLRLYWPDVIGSDVGGVPTHVHMHMHAHMHTHTCMHGKHDNFMQMGAPIGGISYDVIHMCTCMCVCVHVCVCACMHACTHVWGHPLTTPTHIHPPPPTRGDPWNQSKFNSTWTSWDISILFKELKSV